MEKQKEREEGQEGDWLLQGGARVGVLGGWHKAPWNTTTRENMPNTIPAGKHVVGV